MPYPAVSASRDFVDRRDGTGIGLRPAVGNPGKATSAQHQTASTQRSRIGPVARISKVQHVEAATDQEILRAEFYIHGPPPYYSRSEQGLTVSGRMTAVSSPRRERQSHEDARR